MDITVLTSVNNRELYWNVPMYWTTLRARTNKSVSQRTRAMRNVSDWCSREQSYSRTESYVAFVFLAMAFVGCYYWNTECRPSGAQSGNAAWKSTVGNSAAWQRGRLGESIKRGARSAAGGEAEMKDETELSFCQWGIMSRYRGKLGDRYVNMVVLG